MKEEEMGSSLDESTVQPETPVSAGKGSERSLRPPVEAERAPTYAEIGDAYSAWQKARTEAGRLRSAYLRLEQARARSRLTALSPHRRLVLGALVQDEWHGELFFSYLRSIEQQVGLNRTQARRALRSLRTLGFVEYGKGLWTDDGEPAGSGWRITKAGNDWWWRVESARKDGSSNKETDHA